MCLLPLPENANGIVGSTSTAGVGAVTLYGSVNRSGDGPSHFAAYLGFLQSTAITGLADPFADIAI